jgi:TonB family protein
MTAQARVLSFLGAALVLPASVLSQTPTRLTADGWPPPGVHSYNELGVTPPRLIHDVKPQYTSEAMRAGVEGIVELEAVVDVNGHVSAVHIARSLDKLYGVDEQAVRALQQWTFTPGMKDGAAVPVLLSVQLSFNIRRTPAVTLANPSLPKAFSRDANRQMALEPPRGAWETASVDDSGWRIKVSYPYGWTVSALHGGAPSTDSAVPRTCSRCFRDQTASAGADRVERTTRRRAMPNWMTSTSGCSVPASVIIRCRSAAWCGRRKVAARAIPRPRFDRPPLRLSRC